ncbi:MAG: SRPBCC domain-containing protein [Saprospiraceae bacterium]|nr:SRPBCC domain-containing protein [Saprospiraceae bacterium]
MDVLERIEIKLTRDIVFDKFVKHLNDWWPKEYTWSGDKLSEIRIEGRENGLCTEIGPFNFRCDWGRVLTLNPGERIHFKWQISHKREPVPDSDQASDVEVNFIEESKHTVVKLHHFNFRNHGEGADEYATMMGDQYGWPYILNSFKHFCED